MKEIEFVYWLKGAFEMNPNFLKDGISSEQAKTINDHLNLVFDKKTPDRFSSEFVNLDNMNKNLVCEEYKNLKIKPKKDTLFC